MSSSTQPTELFLIFTAPLEALGLRYLVTGSVASILYGEPRMTHDIDIVLELPAREAQRFAAAFPLEEFYCPPAEVIDIEARRRLRGHFNLIHHETGYKADIYLRDEGPLHQWALDHRRSVELPGGRLSIAPPEYVIVSKLAYYREGGAEKHLRDIRGILEVTGDELDDAALAEWVTRLGLDDEWREAEGLVK
jgi:hypothetical protein